MIDIGNFMESLEFHGRELEEALESLENKYEDLFFALEGSRSDLPADLIDSIEELKKQVALSYLNEAQGIYESFINEISKMNISDYYE